MMVSVTTGCAALHPWLGSAAPAGLEEVDGEREGVLGPVVVKTLAGVPLVAPGFTRLTGWKAGPT